jgi:type I restriction enzyme R subunit
MSAAQFLEVAVRRPARVLQGRGRAAPLWSAPDTRKALLAGLADKGFGREPLAEMQKIIEAENSDLFDVLAYVAFAATLSRAERAAAARRTAAEFTDKQQAFVDFVLAQYVKQGVDELDAGEAVTAAAAQVPGAERCLCGAGQAGPGAAGVCGVSAAPVQRKHRRCW